MNKYVIVTNKIRSMGGTQAFAAGRARWLESKGWRTWIFFEDSSEGNCAIPFLNKYWNGRFDKLPLPYHMDEYYRNEILDKMCHIIGYTEGDTVIVESHDDLYSYWGELFAEKVRGRHFFFACDEIFRPYKGYRCTYVDNLDFFKFKYLRRELLATKTKIEKLFNGYANIREPLVNYPSICTEQDMVQDVENEKVNKIPLADWSIACIGRPEKKYFEYVIPEVQKFSEIHADKRINFIIIGDIDSAPNMRIKIERSFYNTKNVNILYLGVLSPIPRALFIKLDVVIAAAQTAKFASYEDVFVITADVTADTTPGVLGYDTQDAWFGGSISGKKYSDVLEDVLVLGKYNNKEFSMPEHHSAEYYYEEQWPYLELADKKNEYYTEKFKRNIRRDNIIVFPFWRVKKDTNILIYGAGMVGQDYLKQIGEYCHIVGIIDANADAFDDTVMLPDDGLKKKNYDYVVLAVLDADIANIMKLKVLEYFPYEDKVIHEPKAAYI